MGEHGDIDLHFWRAFGGSICFCRFELRVYEYE
jgi:hypothetical protein